MCVLLIVASLTLTVQNDESAGFDTRRLSSYGFTEGGKVICAFVKSWFKVIFVIQYATDSSVMWKLETSTENGLTVDDGDMLRPVVKLLDIHRLWILQWWSTCILVLRISVLIEVTELFDGKTNQIRQNQSIICLKTCICHKDVAYHKVSTSVRNHLGRITS